MTRCPCSSGRDLNHCCGPYLDGFPAPTAEALMRSRYSAFVLANEDHLFRTWHPRTRPTLPHCDGSVTWCGLRIVDVVAGGPGDEEGVVEFIAGFRSSGDGALTSELHERSRFTRRAGRWFYVDGEVDPT
ncbi:SecC motif protein [Schaalia sp. 19OD2882]|uniref:YchJ family protein n=1 Tax=Schaalia sp. 19OD2882 TaxID=2794089 RepID=UPI001C1ED56B|nr:YchJ family metal-binding protein [Schaalia sp. 19OD2882]QWW19589.1 SecC motif protein [Schaalia sp. 19OD2882]